MTIRWHRRGLLARLLAWIGLVCVTTIRVDARELLVTTRPFARWRRRRVRAAAVANVFVTADEDHDRFVVRVRDWDGEVHELVALPTLRHARWLEARIEHDLALHHVPEPTEVPPAPGETLEVSSWIA